MRLIKNEFVRFFSLGFAGGALLVAVTMGIGSAGAAMPSSPPAASTVLTR